MLGALVLIMTILHRGSCEGHRHRKYEPLEIQRFNQPVESPTPPTHSLDRLRRRAPES